MHPYVRIKFDQGNLSKLKIALFIYYEIKDRFSSAALSLSTNEFVT